MRVVFACPNGAAAKDLISRLNGMKGVPFEDQRVCISASTLPKPARQRLTFIAPLVEKKEEKKSESDIPTFQ